MNLIELIRINNKTAEHVAQQFENTWLARYPSPNRCLHDNGNKFRRHEFQSMLVKHTIKNVRNHVNDPQSNAICERMHAMIANVSRVYIRTTRIETYDDTKRIMDNALAAMMHATRYAVYHTMKNSPGEIIYGQDMFVDVPIVTDLIAIREQRQALINSN